MAMVELADISAAYGGGRRNCDGRVKTHGVIEANCGPAPEAFPAFAPVGVGRHIPAAAPGFKSMPRFIAVPRSGCVMARTPSKEERAD